MKEAKRLRLVMPPLPLPRLPFPIPIPNFVLDIPGLPPLPLPERLETEMDKALFLQEMHDARAELRKDTSTMVEWFKTSKFPKAPKKP
jgi:hypothetical protein